MFNREVTKGYNYKDYEADEYVADIFKFLTTGKTFSDEVMLAYDFIGGGRVPNLIIKGKSYDDYIKSLYDNPEMVQKLKNMVKPKIIAKNTEGQTILKDFNKEELDDLMEQWQSIFSPSASWEHWSKRTCINFYNLSNVNPFLYIQNHVWYNYVVNSFLKKNGHLYPFFFILRTG